jgi:hypothetical protein
LPIIRSLSTAALLPPRSYGKPEAAAAVEMLLMMDKRCPKRVELYLNDKQ